jgi:hypothetical protein
MLLMLCIAIVPIATYSSSLWLSSWWLLSTLRWRLLFNAGKRRTRPMKRKPAQRTSESQCRSRSRAKPQWVIDEVIRIRAYLPAKEGCRAVAVNFNRRFAPFESVSKSFVNKALLKHRYALAVKKRDIRNAIPIPYEPNQVWGVDLTGKNDVYGYTSHLRDHRPRNANVACFEGITDCRFVDAAGASVSRHQRIRQAQGDSHGSWTTVHQPSLQERACARWHPASAHPRRVPVDERPRRAILWHPQVKAEANVVS